MQRVHRIVLGGIVGTAAVLGVTALATTAGIGGDGPDPAQAQPAALTVTDAPGDVAAARRELERAIRERGAAASGDVAPVPVQAAPVTAGRDDDRWEEDDRREDGDHGDDDHGDDGDDD